MLKEKEREKPEEVKGGGGGGLGGRSRVTISGREDKARNIG